MNLRQCTFLTDENIHPGVVAFLRTRGYDVLDVKESGLIGSADLDLIRKAYSQSRVLLTHDGDFGTLAVAMGEPTPGIVYLRSGHISPEFTIGSLETLFAQELELTPPFLVVVERSHTTVKIRLRNL